MNSLKPIHFVYLFTGLALIYTVYTKRQETQNLQNSFERIQPKVLQTDVSAKEVSAATKSQPDNTLNFEQIQKATPPKVETAATFGSAPLVTSEMMNFQKSPEYIAYIKSMDMNLLKYVSNQALQKKLSTHIEKQLSQPVDFQNPKAKIKLDLSEFERRELAQSIEKASQDSERDQQTLNLMVDIALDAENSTQSKAEILGNNINFEAKDPAQIHQTLLLSLSKASAHGIKASEMKPYLEKSFSNQKDPKVREVFQTTVKQLGF